MSVTLVKTEHESFTRGYYLNFCIDHNLLLGPEGLSVEEHNSVDVQYFVDRIKEFVWDKNLLQPKDIHFLNKLKVEWKLV